MERQLKNVKLINLQCINNLVQHSSIKFCDELKKRVNDRASKLKETDKIFNYLWIISSYEISPWCSAQQIGIIKIDFYKNNKNLV